MREQLKLFRGRKFVIKRNQHASTEENRVSGNQPFRLIGHDNRCARAALKTSMLQRARERQRSLLELTVGEAGVFAFAVRFDQANLVGPALQCRAQSFAQRLIFAKVEHQRRNWMRSASVRKSLTP